MASRPECGIGGCPLRFNNLSESDIDELANYNPVLTYGQSKPAPPEAFIPGYVEWDKKVCSVLYFVGGWGFKPSLVPLNPPSLY